MLITLCPRLLFPSIFYKYKRQYTYLSAREVQSTQGYICKFSSLIDYSIFFGPEKLTYITKIYYGKFTYFSIRKGHLVHFTTFKRYHPDIFNVFCNVKSPFDFLILVVYWNLKLWRGRFKTENLDFFTQLDESSLDTNDIYQNNMQQNAKSRKLQI